MKRRNSPYNGAREQQHGGASDESEQRTGKTFISPKLVRHERLPEITFSSDLFGGDSQFE